MRKARLKRINPKSGKIDPWRRNGGYLWGEEPVGKGCKETLNVLEIFCLDLGGGFG